MHFYISSYSLLLASFNAIPFTEDNLYGFQYIGEQTGNTTSIEPEVLSDSLLWPREPSQMSRELLLFSLSAAQNLYHIETVSLCNQMKCIVQYDPDTIFRKNNFTNMYFYATEV